MAFWTLSCLCRVDVSEIQIVSFEQHLTVPLWETFWQIALYLTSPNTVPYDQTVNISFLTYEYVKLALAQGYLFSRSDSLNNPSPVNK